MYGAGAEKPLQKADFAMKQTNICRLSGDIMIIASQISLLDTKCTRFTMPILFVVYPVQLHVTS